LKSPRFGNSCPGELKHDEFENPPTHRRRVGVVRHFPYTGRGEASPKTDDLDSSVAAQCVAAKPDTRTGIVQPPYLVVGDTDIAKSRHIGWVAIHDMKFTISILYLLVTEILCCQ
jgi:hypothetical protein